MKTLLYILVISFLAVSVFAQPNPETLWTRVMGGANIDYCHAIQQTANGGYILAGETNSFGNYSVGAYAVRLNDAGDLLWSQTYGAFNTSSNNKFTDVQQTADHGYIFAGNTNTGNWNDMYVVKTDSSGDTSWTRTFSDPFATIDIFVTSVLQTGDGYVIAGYASSWSPHGYICLIKTDLAGDTLWTRFMRSRESIAYEYVLDMATTADGGFILAGRRYEGIGENIDALLMKLSASGEVEWWRSYGYPTGSEEMNSVEQTNDGGYILAGMTSSTANHDADMYVVRTAADGDTVWTRMIGTTGTETAQSIHETEGGFAVAGSQTPTVGMTDFYLVKLDPNGNMMWNRTYGGTNAEMLNAMQCTSDGGYLTAGSTMSFGAGSWDIYLVKTGPDVTSSTEQTVFVPGSSALMAYPNPFNAITTVTYSLAQAGTVQLYLYDVLGRRVAVLHDGLQQAGEHNLSWNGAECASGVYFAKLTSGTTANTMKLMLLK